MKRNLLFGTVFSAALAVGVAAQGGSTGTTSGGQTGMQNQQNQVTVTGCLQNADMAGGTAGTSGSGTSGSTTSGSQTSASSSAQFMLTNAKMAKTGASASGTSSSGTSGTSGTTSATSGTSGATSSNRFLLVGGTQQNLKQYLNSEVEVRGRLDQEKGGMSSGSASSGTTSSGTGSAAGSATGQSTSSQQSDAQKLHVTSVRQIASTCTGR